MDVSVIIPALNEAANIGRAIQCACRAGAAEVLVADGGSTDGTLEIVGGHPCQLVCSAPGRARQQNAAARRALGEVLLFQHADNWLSEGAIEQVKRALRDPAVLGGAFRQRIEAEGFLYRLLEWGNACRVRWLGLPFGDQGIFLRRDVFHDLGGFADVGLMEDLLLMSQLRRRRRPALLPGPLHVSARRWKRHGVVGQTVRNWILLLAYQLGVSPNRLAGYYLRHDQGSR